MIFLQQIFDIFLHSDLQQQCQKNAVNQYSIFCNISCMAPAQRRFYIFRFVILSLESQQKCIKFNIILFLQKLILCSLLAINKIHFLKCCHALVSNTQQVLPQIIELFIFVTLRPEFMCDFIALQGYNRGRITVAQWMGSSSCAVACCFDNSITYYIYNNDYKRDLLMFPAQSQPL